VSFTPWHAVEAELHELGIVSPMKQETRKTGLLLATALVGYFSLATITAGANLFPLSGCAAPWVSSGNYTCLSDLARLTGNTFWCDVLPGELPRQVCVAALALRGKDATVCVSGLAPVRTTSSESWGEPAPFKDLAVFDCFKDLHYKDRDPKLCQHLTDSYWQRLCVQAYREVAVPPQIGPASSD